MGQCRECGARILASLGVCVVCRNGHEDKKWLGEHRLHSSSLGLVELYLHTWKQTYISFFWSLSPLYIFCMACSPYLNRKKKKRNDSSLSSFMCFKRICLECILFRWSYQRNCLYYLYLDDVICSIFWWEKERRKWNLNSISFSTQVYQPLEKAQLPNSG